MAVSLEPDVLNDDIAMTGARIIAAANRKAKELGVDLPNSIRFIVQGYRGDTSVWQVSYGPRDYINKRGGDLIIELDAETAAVTNVLRGQ